MWASHISKRLENKNPKKGEKGYLWGEKYGQDFLKHKSLKKKPKHIIYMSFEENLFLYILDLPRNATSYGTSLHHLLLSSFMA